MRKLREWSRDGGHYVTEFGNSCLQAFPLLYNSRHGKAQRLTKPLKGDDMNVMAKAHNDTKSLIAKMSPEGQAQVKADRLYRRMFAINLKQAHKEYKTMTQANDWKTKVIADAQARVVELEAIETTDGFIVVVGDNIRLPLDEVQGKWCKVENASLFWYKEDAQRFASRVVNGNNEVGQVVKKIDQIKWEIEEQQKLIDNLKNS